MWLPRTGFRKNRPIMCTKQEWPHVTTRQALPMGLCQLLTTNATGNPHKRPFVMGRLSFSQRGWNKSCALEAGSFKVENSPQIKILTAILQSNIFILIVYFIWARLENVTYKNLSLLLIRHDMSGFLFNKCNPWIDSLSKQSAWKYQYLSIIINLLLSYSKMFTQTDVFWITRHGSKRTAYIYMK